jgi:ribosome maturation protein SDO1
MNKVRFTGGQVRLTNVAYVRLMKKGKRFEIACYRNKVLNWRNKIETDLDEVLQIDTIFINVSKGLLASSKDLLEAFGTSDQKEVCREILNKGELQVSDQERAALYESIFRDIASIVADKTINTETDKPFTVSMIQNAMRQIQYSISVTKSSKSQALDVIKRLKDVMPIMRANMLLRVVCTPSEMEAIKPEVEPLIAVLISSELQTQLNEENLVFQMDPEFYRKLQELVGDKTLGKTAREVFVRPLLIRQCA